MVQHEVWTCISCLLYWSCSNMQYSFLLVQEQRMHS